MLANPYTMPAKRFPKSPIANQLTALKTKNPSSRRGEENSVAKPKPSTFQPDESIEIAQIQRTTFYGPIPHPSILEGYEKIVSGAANRILAMAEANAKHTHALEIKALEIKSAEIKRGQIFGFSIGLAALGVCVYALIVGAHGTATSIGGITLVGLVSAFILGRLPSKKEK